MNSREKSTEWALLFPLKAGLFAVKSSISSRSLNKDRDKGRNDKNLQIKSKMRRGSSLSDLDKWQGKLMGQNQVLPDIVRSTEKCSESLPQSPALSRGNLQLSNCHNQGRGGSIGDLMNLKKYGGSTWSVKSETLIAKFIPLSTVTPRHSPPTVDSDCDLIPSPDDDSWQEQFNQPLTCAQRTRRLSRLIKSQRRTKDALNSCVLKRKIVSFYLSIFFLKINWSLSIYF